MDATVSEDLCEYLKEADKKSERCFYGKALPRQSLHVALPYLQGIADKSTASSAQGPPLDDAGRALPSQLHHEVELVRHGVAEEHLRAVVFFRFCLFVRSSDKKKRAVMYHRKNGHVCNRRTVRGTAPGRFTIEQTTINILASANTQLKLRRR